ncbi:MAG TPA: hypothetical protein PKA10_00270 [Selenomonadales bacterium]|nr:hypothetical protein [Selenomonadales bacterium]
MLKKHCHKKHMPMGMLGMAVLSAALTVPLIYYAMDIAHSLRILAHDDSDAGL